MGKNNQLLIQSYYSILQFKQLYKFEVKMTSFVSFFPQKNKMDFFNNSLIKQCSCIDVYTFWFFE